MTHDGSLPRACAVLLLGLAPLAGFAQTPAAPPAPAPAAKAPAMLNPDQAGYILGVNFGSQMQRIGITNQVSIGAVARGIKDGLAGRKTDPAEQQRLQAFVRVVMQASLTRHEAAARAFLARNGRRPGVETTASGLQYRILAAGDAKAAAPAPTDIVTVHYRGRLIDGTEFDSSYKRGRPATFPVDAVIKGWQEALAMMRPGASWELFIPPDLGYGQSPRPGIPPGSLLIFDVRLLSVKRQPAANGAPAAHPASPPQSR
ncbi:MAG TPA: FKBP-type peptidyl-prolyl cis-trans isomerase [Steroidobacteraceae bacterium]|nr:FKBP-type peptidyl-prolyl cis-trans isomerase [Steroidobacteraceae bacterium]